MDKNWEKPVPMAVLSQFGLQRFHSLQQNTPSGGRTSGAPTGTTTGSGGNGGSTGGSGSRGGGGSGGSTRSVRVNNTEFNSMFQPYHDMRYVTCQMLKTKIANGELPPLPLSKANANVPMCLPWHTRAQCMTNCNSAVYTLEEYSPHMVYRAL